MSIKTKQRNLWKQADKAREKILEKLEIGGRHHQDDPWVKNPIFNYFDLEKSKKVKDGSWLIPIKPGFLQEQGIDPEINDMAIMVFKGREVSNVIYHDGGVIVTHLGRAFGFYALDLKLLRGQFDMEKIIGLNRADIYLSEIDIGTSYCSIASMSPYAFYHREFTIFILVTAIDGKLTGKNAMLTSKISKNRCFIRDFLGRLLRPISYPSRRN